MAVGNQTALEPYSQLRLDINSDDLSVKANNQYHYTSARTWNNLSTVKQSFSIKLSGLIWVQKAWESGGRTVISVSLDLWEVMWWPCWWVIRVVGVVISFWAQFNHSSEMMWPECSGYIRCISLVGGIGFSHFSLDSPFVGNCFSFVPSSESQQPRFVWSESRRKLLVKSMEIIFVYACHGKRNFAKIPWSWKP